MKSPRRVSLLMLLLVACGPKAGDADAATEATSSDDGDTQATVTGGPPPASECLGAPATSTAGIDPRSDLSCPDHGPANTCCCFEDNGWHVNNVCEQHFPCPEIVVSRCYDGTQCDLFEQLIDCPEAVDCALATLAAGGTGTLQWKIYNDVGAEEMQLHLIGDGTAFRYWTYYFDLGCEVDPFTRNTLWPPSYFAECATKPSVFQRFACVQGAFTGAPLETCIDTLSCGAL